MAAALDEAARRLGTAGVAVREVTLPEPFAGLSRAQQTVMAYEAARALAAAVRNAPDRVSPQLRDLLAAGAACPDEEYATALALAASCRGMLAVLFSDIDILLTPSAPGEAPEGLGATGDPVFNRMWTLLHAPCISVPGLTGPAGLPVGVQVVGAPGSDAQTLAAAAVVERALDPGRS
jgi:Asp-tRNA(Asn)/Glu-tRNA(Gln) amidotransferase A subunit family amidase